MIIKNFGEGNLGNYALESLDRNKPLELVIDKLFYWYEYEYYEGYGQAVYQDSNKDWHYDELGHCSCYGPFDDGFNKITYKLEDIIKLLERDAEYNHELFRKKLIEGLKNETK